MNQKEVLRKQRIHLLMDPVQWNWLVELLQEPEFSLSDDCIVDFLNLSFNCFLFCCPEVLLQCSARLSPVAVRGSFSLCAASLVGEHRL